MTIWHWIAALAVVVLFCATKGAVRGGIVILTMTFFTARILYLWVTSGS